MPNITESSNVNMPINISCSIIGTANVGKSSILNSLAGMTIVKESPIVDTTQEVTFLNITSKNSYSFKLFDTPGFHGIADYPPEVLHDIIKRGYSHCKENLPIQNKVAFNSVDRILQVQKMNVNPGFYAINCFVIDLANGFKRADLDVFNKIQDWFPNKPMILIANNCHYITYYHRSKIIRDIQSQVKVPVIKRFLKSSVIGTSRFRNKFLFFLCREIHCQSNID